MKIIFTLLVSLWLVIPSITFAKNIDDYAADCKEIGFKPKTEKFGDCVLELKKRDKSHSTITSVATVRGDGSPDDSQCISYGFKPGTETYAMCREKIDQNRKLQAAQERHYQEQLQTQQNLAAQRQQAEAEQLKEADRRSGWEMLFRGLQMMGSQPGTTAISPTAPRFLRSQYYSNGNNMCNYDDGSTINVGAGICPNTR
jgi:hypothetical protein